MRQDEIEREAKRWATFARGEIFEYRLPWPYTDFTGSSFVETWIREKLSYNGTINRVVFKRIYEVEYDENMIGQGKFIKEIEGIIVPSQPIMSNEAYLWPD